MGFTLAQQGACFFAAFLLGLCLGLLYEAFRFLRMIFSSRHGVFFLDFLYVLIFGLSTIFLSMAYSDGSVRYFTLIGEICGVFVIRYTLGRFTSRIFPKVLKLSGKIIKIVTEFAAKIAKKLLQPVVSLLYNKTRKNEVQSD